MIVPTNYCDRCGRSYSSLNKIDVEKSLGVYFLLMRKRIDEEGFTQVEEDFELCDKCLKKLVKWVKKGKRKKYYIKKIIL